MSSLEFSQTHALSRAAARTRIKRLTDYWHHKYAVSVKWAEDEVAISGKVKGITFDAHLVVADSSVLVTGSDPGFLFRRSVKNYLKEKLALYVDAAVAVDDLENS